MAPTAPDYHYHRFKREDEYRQWWVLRWKSLEARRCIDCDAYQYLKGGGWMEVATVKLPTFIIRGENNE